MQPNCGCQTTSFVWVNKEKKLVWYEVPKATSSSIKKVLGIVGPLTDDNSGFVNVEVTPQQAAQQYSSFKGLALIRNPWDKMVSNYFMFCLSKNEFRNNQLRELFEIGDHRIGFQDFLQRASRVPNHHWAENSCFLPIDSQANLSVDYLAEIDSIKPVFESLSNYLAEELRVPALNRTKHNHYSHYYDTEARYIVAEMFAGDIRIFDFNFLADSQEVNM